jgi:hypothetical protein
MQPRQHQIKIANEAVELIKDYNLAYIAAEERTGKTLAAILVAEQLKAKCLVITKAKAIPGWLETLAAYKASVAVDVVSFHQAYKQTADYELIIVDEAHSMLSAYPKPGKIQQQVKAIAKSKQVLYLSATPHAQGYAQLFHQLQVSSFSPFRSYANFYAWFSHYGKAYTIKVNGFDLAQYDRVKDEEIVKATQHLFIKATRAELGFEHEPTDQVHYVELSADTKYAYNELLTHKLIETSAGVIVADNISKLRTSLHQIEGGTIKIDNTYHVLRNQEKIDYIKKHFKDSNELVIMYNYKAELTKLQQHFKNAVLLQGTSYAEGVDLSGHKHLVIYSQDFSTARHTQRRARQANVNRTLPINVHFLLVKKAISDEVYKTVSVNKKNYVDSVFGASKL